MNIGFFAALALVFITLKLTGTITWSWLWVLVPLWGPITLILAGLFVWAVCVVIKLLLSDR